MDISFLDGLNIKATKDASLTTCTTFKLGGRCPWLIECSDANTLQEIIARLRAHKADFLLMGFGSNILASDHGTRKIIVRYTSDKPLITRDGATVSADAATQLNDLVAYTLAQEFDGLLALSAIPGTVGGAIAGNAGAFGQQISDRLLSVTVLKPDGNIAVMNKNKIAFTYRDSPFKHNDDIILSATFNLTPCDDEALRARHDEILKERKFKLDFWRTTPCAGSFFRNIEPTSKAEKRQAAGWFLEQSGAKGLAINGARVYEEHANIITHDGNAKAQDVYDLSQKMAALVAAKYKIALVREVRLLGKFDNAPDCQENNYW